MAGWILRRAIAIAMRQKIWQKKGVFTEVEVARQAVELAKAGMAGKAGRTGHVGFYLIDKGLPEIERAAEVLNSLNDLLRRKLARHPLLIYLGAIGLITAILTGVFWRWRLFAMPQWAWLPMLACWPCWRAASWRWRWSTGWPPCW
jgi:hypothetical protein